VVGGQWSVVIGSHWGTSTGKHAEPVEKALFHGLQLLRRQSTELSQEEFRRQQNNLARAWPDRFHPRHLAPALLALERKEKKLKG
jgi:hypothetical protein